MFFVDVPSYVMCRAGFKEYPIPKKRYRGAVAGLGLHTVTRATPVDVTSCQSISTLAGILYLIQCHYTAITLIYMHCSATLQDI